MTSSSIDVRAKARAHLPALPALPELYAAAQATWLARMVNEYASSEVFEALSLQLAHATFDRADVERCRAFADEEKMHGVLCGAVVEAAGGFAVAPWPARPPFPRHEHVPPIEAALRNLLSICCLSETVAVALLSAERLSMPESPLRDLLTTIYADEIGHARFGWRLLTERSPALDDDARARLSTYLQVAFAALEAHELSHLPTSFRPPPEGKSLGLCSGLASRRLFYETVTEAIVPQLDALGLDGSAAWKDRRVAASCGCFSCCGH